MTTQVEVVIGVLALQGAFIEHIDYFKNATKHSYPKYSFQFIEVRTEDQLKTCDALVIPGGESTSISLIAERTKLLAPLMDFVKSEKPIWGICAGLIFLAKEVLNGKPSQKILGGLSIQVKRNAFGRQLDSFETNLDFSSFVDGVDDFPTVFIRAPVISKILDTTGPEEEPQRKPHKEEKDQGQIDPGQTVRSTNDYDNKEPATVLYKLPDGLIVAVRQGNKLGTSFHPELSNDYRFHKWFMDEFVIKSL